MLFIDSLAVHSNRYWPFTPRLLYPASLKLSVLVRIRGGTVGTGRGTVTSQLLHPPVCVIIAYTGHCGVVGTRRSFRGEAAA